MPIASMHCPVRSLRAGASCRRWRASAPGLGLAGAVKAAPKQLVGRTKTTPGKKKGGGSNFGCTNLDNACAGGAPPLSRRARLLRGDNKGKPLCIVGALCASCKRDANCHKAFGPTAVCIRKCPNCQLQHVKSACAVPVAAATKP